MSLSFPSMMEKKSVTVEESEAIATPPSYEGKPKQAAVTVIIEGLDDPDAGKSQEERLALDKKILWKVDMALIPWLW
jgi:hypothetical protein